MARKLKTYQTSLGFFDLAVAAPSMAAALRAWGSDTNLFHQGLAKQTDDPAIVAATLAKPGVVLRRPVGSDGAFSERAKLPKELPVDQVKEGTAKPRAPTGEPPAQKVDDEAARAAALALERERKRRDRERRKEEAAREKERRRREQAIAKAEGALEEAKRDHEGKAEQIERDRAALERRSQAEDARWEKQKEQLEAALRRARCPRLMGSAPPATPPSTGSATTSSSSPARPPDLQLDQERRRRQAHLLLDRGRRIGCVELLNSLASRILPSLWSRPEYCFDQ